MARAAVVERPGTVTLTAGDLRAVVLPHAGMLVASLTHRGDEVLGRVDDLDGAAARGATAGIPLMHPWANRLGSSRLAVDGRDVSIDTASPLLAFDARGLPIHGVPWPRLAWRVAQVSDVAVEAELDWDSPALLAVFPFEHRLCMTIALEAGRVAILTTLLAARGVVPAAFGFHPYFTLPGVAREHYRLRLPAMRRLALDARMLPTGASSPFAAFDAPLRDLAFDDGFDYVPPGSPFAIEGGKRRIAVVPGEGFPCAQVYAPPGQPFVALEPMTAPTNALASGDGLAYARPGAPFVASFRIEVGDIPPE